MNDRQTGPAEEGEARLASPSSQSSVQQSIPDEVVRRLLDAPCVVYASWNAQPETCQCGNCVTRRHVRAALAGSTVSGQGEQTYTESLKNGVPR